MATKAKQWKKKDRKGPQELELPSGNTCLVNVPGIEAFLQKGLIPNSLAKIIQKSIAKAQKGQDVETELEATLPDLMQDPEKMASVFDMADIVTLECVVEPKVLPKPAEGEARDEDALYVDDVDLDDKLYIMDFAFGGARRLEPFRGAASPGVADVSAGNNIPLPS